MSSIHPFPENEEFEFGNPPVVSNDSYSKSSSRSVSKAAESSLVEFPTSDVCGIKFSKSQNECDHASCGSPYVTSLSGAMSKANSTFSWILSKSTLSIFQLKRAPWIPKKRSGSKRSNFKSSNDNRKPVLLRKVPFGKSSKYLKVYVGTRIEQSVKFVISRTLLVHPLFQVLLKCSEDEFGEDYAVNNGVAIVCDVALFLQVVRAVDDSLWSDRNTESHNLQYTRESARA